MSLYKILLRVFAIIGVVFFGLISLGTVTTSVGSIGLIVSLIGMIAVFLGEEHINYWWIERHKTTLDEQQRVWVQRFYSPYSDLDDDKKEVFEYNLARFMAAFDYKMQLSTPKEAPEDVKLWIAISAVRLCKAYDPVEAFQDFENYLVYRHPFPTPRIKKFHTVEIDPKDGLMLFSLDQLLASVIYNNRHYNIGLHAFIEAFILKTEGVVWPIVTDDHIIRWENYKFPLYRYIIQWTGLAYIDPLIIAIHHYTWFGDLFKEVEPDLFDQLNKIFSLYE